MTYNVFGGTLNTAQPNPTMLNELNCTFDVSYSRFHCCDRHGHGLWPSWFVAIMAVAVMAVVVVV